MLSLQVNKSLPDHEQNFWQMASIQSAAFGIPTLLVGAQLGQQYGPGAALISIFIGNLVLWVLGFAIIAMTVDKRTNATQNLRGYIGRYGCLIAGVTLSLAFIFWYSIQITESMGAAGSFLHPYFESFDAVNIRIGAAIGILAALLAIGGIRIIKWYNVAAFPFLLVFIIYGIIKNDNPPVLKGTWGVSTPVVIAALMLALPGVVNLPTFFRHRKTPSDAFLALSLFMVFTAIIESLAIFLIDAKTGKMFFEYLAIGPIHVILICLFFILAIICANLVNIYFASAAWEVILPWLNTSKELALIGMAGTVTYTFLQEQLFLGYFESLVSSFIANLGIVVIIGYSVQKAVVHRQRKYEMVMAFGCWLLGCAVTTSIQDMSLKASISAFALGIAAIALAYALLIFFEEVCWSIKTKVSGH